MKRLKNCIWVFWLLISSLFALDWTPVSVAGLGNIANTILFPGPVVQGYFYVGTYNTSTGGQLFRTSDGVNFVAVSSDGFGIGMANNSLVPYQFPFNNELFIFSKNGTAGFQVWKSSTGNSGSWINVGTNGLTYGGLAAYVSGSCVFNNELYVGFSENATPHLLKNTGNTNWIEIPVGSLNIWSDLIPEGNFNGYLYMSGGVKVWRYNGSVWETITTNGFGDTSVYGFLPAYQGFNNNIYLGANSDSGAQIWRSDTGAPGSWTRIFDFNTIDSNNTEINSFSIPGDGYLYFSTYNHNGTEIWRTAGGISDFEQVNTNGFVQGTMAIGTNQSCVLARNLFNDMLIAGTMNITTGGLLYGTPLTLPSDIPAEVTNVLKEEALQILGSDIPGFEGTFVPGEGPLKLSLDGVQFGIVHFRIFTLTGETIFDGEVTSDANGNFQLNLPNDLAAGVYIIRVEGPNFHFTKKLAILE